MMIITPKAHQPYLTGALTGGLRGSARPRGWGGRGYIYIYIYILGYVLIDV